MVGWLAGSFAGSLAGGSAGLRHFAGWNRSFGNELVQCSGLFGILSSFFAEESNRRIMSDSLDPGGGDVGDVAHAPVEKVTNFLRFVLT